MAGLKILEQLLEPALRATSSARNTGRGVRTWAFRGDSRVPQAARAPANRTQGEWWTSNYDDASGYRLDRITNNHELNTHVRMAELDMRRPLVVDGQGKRWTALSVDDLPAELQPRMREVLDRRNAAFRAFDEQLTGRPASGLDDVFESASVTTDDIAMLARREGYDGVVFRNLVDGRSNSPTDVYYITRHGQASDSIPARFQRYVVPAGAGGLAAIGVSGEAEGLPQTVDLPPEREGNLGDRVLGGIGDFAAREASLYLQDPTDYMGDLGTFLSVDPSLKSAGTLARHFDRERTEPDQLTVLPQDILRTVYSGYTGVPQEDAPDFMQVDRTPAWEQSDIRAPIVDDPDYRFYHEGDAGPLDFAVAAGDVPLAAQGARAAARAGRRVISDLIPREPAFTYPRNTFPGDPSPAVRLTPEDAANAEAGIERARLERLRDALPWSEASGRGGRGIPVSTENPPPVGTPRRAAQDRLLRRAEVEGALQEPFDPAYARTVGGGILDDAAQQRMRGAPTYRAEARNINAGAGPELRRDPLLDAYSHTPAERYARSAINRVFANDLDYVPRRPMPPLNGADEALPPLTSMELTPQRTFTPRDAVAVGGAAAGAGILATQIEPPSPAPPERPTEALSDFDLAGREPPIGFMPGPRVPEYGADALAGGDYITLSMGPNGVFSFENLEPGRSTGGRIGRGESDAIVTPDERFFEPVMIDDERERMDLQDRLRRAGFDPGPTDGVVGKNTQDAIDGIFTAYGEPAPTSYDPATLSRAYRYAIGYPANPVSVDMLQTVLARDPELSAMMDPYGVDNEYGSRTRGALTAGTGVDYGPTLTPAEAEEAYYRRLLGNAQYDALIQRR